MKIIVPSIGRAGKCNSMKWLPEANRPIVFAVHSDEVEAYRAAYPGCSIMHLSDSCCKHTGLVRKEIMESVREPFIFVDDDIRVSLKAVNSVEKMIEQIEEHVGLGGFSMAGLAPQLFSNYAVDKVETIGHDFFAIRNKFVATVYGINPTHFDDCPLEVLPVYEDIALVIHAIERGNGTIVTYCATHSNVSPSVGGCNSWRNEQITIDCLMKLVNLYPHVCSIRETKNTTHSQNIGIGLRVAWSKIKKLELPS